MTRYVVLSKLRFVIAVLIATVIIGALTWMSTFKTIKATHSVAAGKSFMFVGRVVESYRIDDLTYYRLKDFTGDIWVVSRRGNPVPDNLIMLYGSTSRSSAGRPTVDEQWRIGSF